MGDLDAEDPVLWEPSDEWLASLVRKLRGMPLDAPVPPSLLTSWRAHFREELRRVARARAAGREPYPPSLSLGDRSAISAGEVVLDLLRSPEGRFLVGVALAMPAMLDGLAHSGGAVVALWRAEYERRLVAREVARDVAGYLDWKLGPSGRPFRGELPHSVYRAAANAATDRRVRQWRALLCDARAAAGVLEEMDQVGREASRAAAPLRIWDPEPGPPRGIWPDPPAEEDLEDETPAASGKRGGGAPPPRPAPGGGA